MRWGTKQTRASLRDPDIFGGFLARAQDPGDQNGAEEGRDDQVGAQGKLDIIPLPLLPAIIQRDNPLLAVLALGASSSIIRMCWAKDKKWLRI